MSGHEVLIAVMGGFAVLGAVDRVLGNRFGIGDKFEEGILSMGSLAMAMLGVICLAPVLAAVLKPVVVPVFSALGADPAMFAGSILACDMGGGSLARERPCLPLWGRGTACGGRGDTAVRIRRRVSAKW